MDIRSLLNHVPEMTRLPQGSPPTRLTVPWGPQLVIVSRRLSIFDESVPNIYPIPETPFKSHEEPLQTNIDDGLSIGWGPFEVIGSNTPFVGECPQALSVPEGSTIDSGDDRAPCTGIVKLWLDPPCAGASRRSACVSSEHLCCLPRIGGWQVVGDPFSSPWTRYLVMLVPDQGQNAQWTWMTLEALCIRLPGKWEALVTSYRSAVEMHKRVEEAKVRTKEVEWIREDDDDDEGDDEEDDEEYDEEYDEEDNEEIAQGSGRLSHKRNWEEANNEGHEGRPNQLQEQERQREVGPGGNLRPFLGHWSWAAARSVPVQTCSSSISPCTKASPRSNSSSGSPTMQSPTASAELIPEAYPSQQQSTQVFNSFVTVNSLSPQLASPCQLRPLSNGTSCTTGEGLSNPPASTPSTLPGPSNPLKRARLGTRVQSRILDLPDLYEDSISDGHYRTISRKNTADLNTELELDTGNVPLPVPAGESKSSTDDLVLDLDKPLPKSLTTRTAFAAKQQVSTAAIPSLPTGIAHGPHSVIHQSSKFPSDSSSPLSSLAPSPPPPPPPPPAAQTSRQQLTRAESHWLESSSLMKEQCGSVYLQLHGKISVRRSARLGARGLAEIPRSLMKPLSRERLMKAKVISRALMAKSVLARGLY